MAGLLCSFWAGSSYFNWITQSKNLYPQTQLSQHQWGTARRAWDCWSPAILYLHQRSKTLVWGLLEPQPHRTAPRPGTYLSRVRGAGGAAGAPWAGGGVAACAARWHSLEGHSAAGGLGKWVGWAELCFTPPVSGSNSWAAQSSRAQGWGRYRYHRVYVSRNCWTFDKLSVYCTVL